MGTTNNKLLAAFAVFRELDKEGKSILEILCAFILDAIKDKELHRFNLNEITTQLNTIYHFQIPEAVINSALQSLVKDKILNYEKYYYGVLTLPASIGGKSHINNKASNYIIDELHIFLEQKTNTDISNGEKQEIEKSFLNFLLDNTVDKELSNYFSELILVKKEDEKFMRNLQSIREGIILYTGIQYSPSFSQSSWKNKLVIYLTMEELFHFSKYNGELYFTLFNDFYKLVGEINKSKKLIYLRYFQEVKDEIDHFFKVAKEIKLGKKALIPTNEAMGEIVNGCKDVTAIRLKKQQLYSFLETSGIVLDDTKIEILDEENQKYNIISSDLFSEQSDFLEIESIERYAKLLNYISIKRKEREENNFDNVGYILLTENRKINYMAWSKKVKKKGNVPLSTNLQFLTIKLWFRLNKGFGTDSYPTSFNIITKAQLILSSHISDKLNENYQELIKEVEKGKLSEDDIKSVLSEIKQNLRLPEEVKCDDIPDIIALLTSTDTIDKYIKEHSYIKEKAVQEEIKNSKLNIALEKSKQQINTTEQEADYYKDKYLNEQTKKFDSLSIKQQKIKSQVDRIFKREQFLAFIAYVSVLVYIAYKYINWDSFEKWAWLATLIVPGSIFFFKEKIQAVQSHIANRKKTILNSLYSKNNFNIEEMDILSKEIEELKK